MSTKLTKMDANCARSRSGLSVSSDSMIGARRCWKVQVSPKPKGQKRTTDGVDKLKTPEVRSFGFAKFVDDSPSFLIVAAIVWVPSCAAPGRGIESGGGITSW